MLGHADAAFVEIHRAAAIGVDFQGRLVIDENADFLHDLEDAQMNPMHLFVVEDFVIVAT